MIRARAVAMGALVAALVTPGRARPEAPPPLLEPTRCVSDYLEALAAAAPPRPRGRGASAPPAGEGRWSRALAHLAPPAPGGPRRLSPGSELGRDGAFLGYELLRVRRAPRGAAVVTAVERTIRSPGAAPTSTACAYLVARFGGEWLIADRRCSGDFSDADVLAWEGPGWDAPEATSPPAGPGREELLPDDPE